MLKIPHAVLENFSKPDVYHLKVRGSGMVGKPLGIHIRRRQKSGVMASRRVVPVLEPAPQVRRPCEKKEKKRRQYRFALSIFSFLLFSLVRDLKFKGVK